MKNPRILEISLVCGTKSKDNLSKNLKTAGLQGYSG